MLTREERPVRKQESPENIVLSQKPREENVTRRKELTARWTASKKKRKIFTALPLVFIDFDKQF